ncbi:MAG: phosphotransferase [Oscillospiraceae bacterium]|jgi:aminoglycoside phosphotransferase (APT) family kinase protein|nr:phosphotransferase [Oscillospiraceae bacterium]
MGLDKSALLAALPEKAERYLGKMPAALKSLGGGSFGKAFRLDFPDGERLVIKAYRVEGMNETEAFQLRLLGSHTHVPMPQVLFTAENLLGMSYIEGHDVLTGPGFLLKAKALRQRFAEAVIDGMLPWHDTEGPAFGYVTGPNHKTWPEFYRTIVDEVIAALPTLGIAQKQKDSIYAATERFGDIVWYDGTPRLIHGDLNVMNIMADPKTFRLTGFIDPFNSMWADPEYDLFQLNLLTGKRFGLLGSYQAKRRTSGRCELKIAYYAAVNEALAYLRSGIKFELNHIICDRRLRREMQRAGMKTEI